MSSRKPPQPAPRWNHTPEEVSSKIRAQIAESRALYARIAALPPADCTFATVFLPLAVAEAKIDAVCEPLAFYQNVAPDAGLRDASSAGEVLMKEFEIEKHMNAGVFEAMRAAQAHGAVQGAEEKRLMDRMLRDGKRAGLALPQEKQAALQKFKNELAALCVEFNKNCNEEKGTIGFTRAELQGVPEDVISGYKKTDDKDEYLVTFRTPDIIPLMRYASDPQTRKRAFIGYESRVPQNAPLFARILDIRRECAAILGYDTWADFITETKMVKTADNVQNFLTDLETKLKPVGDADLKNLLALKQKEESTNDSTFYIWDWRYYDRLHVERSLDLDDAKVKEYFPVSVVVPEIMKIYETLLSVRFEELPGSVEDGSVWHADVKRYAVWEAGADGAFIGYTYLDIYPREGKYSHAAVWPLINGYEDEQGGHIYPLTAMVANLAKPTGDRPALMPHDDVVTFFHEMGHVFHGLLSRTRFSRFHGTNVARDFVEAPSQMLESWCWEPTVLTRISQHFETKQPLSSELIDKLIKSRFVNIGMFTQRQMFFGKFDIKVHTDKGAEDYTALWESLRSATCHVTGPETPCPGQGTFAHLTGDYDAGYYGYLYSLVFAADMYATVFKHDPLSAAAGTRYRKEILSPGGSRDEADSLKAFLGREPRSDAFLEQMLGASAAPVSVAA